MEILVLNNLFITLLLLGLIGGFWLVNFLMGLYVNIGIKEQKWDWAIFRYSLIKLVLLLASTLLTVLLVTIFPAILDYAGAAIEPSIAEALNIITIISVLVMAIGIYGMQAIKKITDAFGAANGKQISSKE